MFGIVILAVYAVLMIGVTLMFTRKTTDAEGFHVADRRSGLGDCRHEHRRHLDLGSLTVHFL